MARLDAKFLKRFWVKETPSGTVDGSNVTFTLSQPPVENDSVVVTLDGLSITDYSLSGVTITMTTAPAFGQILKASYVQNQGE